MPTDSNHEHTYNIIKRKKFFVILRGVTTSLSEARICLARVRLFGPAPELLSTSLSVDCQERILTVDELNVVKDFQSLTINHNLPLLRFDVKNTSLHGNQA